VVIISEVRRVEFVSYRTSNIIRRVRWCHIIVLNGHTPKEDKIDYVKGSFYEELERVFDKFPKYNMKILLGDFNAKGGREEIFSFHEISNDNGIRLVNFATSKDPIVKSTIQCSHIATSINILGRLQMGEPTAD
jgi:hypothetical protein